MLQHRSVRLQRGELQRLTSAWSAHIYPHLLGQHVRDSLPSAAGHARVTQRILTSPNIHLQTPVLQLWCTSLTDDCQNPGTSDAECDCLQEWDHGWAWMDVDTTGAAGDLNVLPACQIIYRTASMYGHVCVRVPCCASVVEVIVACD